MTEPQEHLRNRDSQGRWALLRAQIAAGSSRLQYIQGGMLGIRVHGQGIRGSGGSDTNIGGPPNFSASGNAILTTASLTGALGSNDVSVTTGSGNITIASSFSYNSAHNLTLVASSDINVNNSLSITNAGSGNMTFNAGNNIREKILIYPRNNNTNSFGFTHSQVRGQGRSSAS